MSGKSSMKSWLAIIISLALALALIVGCGSSTASTPTTAPSSSTSSGAATKAPGATTPGAAATPATGASSSATITLKVADMFPATHGLVANGIQVWMDRVTALTNGQVKFEYYPAEQLGKVLDNVTLLSAGGADIAYVAPMVLATDFPLHGVTGIPGVYSTAMEGTKFYNQVAKEGPLREEFTKKNLQPLFYYGVPAYEVISVKKPVATLEDVKGMKLAVIAAQQQVAQALGGIGVTVTAPDLYTTIQRGTVDGSIMTYGASKNYKLNELIKYATEGAAISSGVVGYCMTTAGWNKLPKDVQDAMVKAGEEAVLKASTYQDELAVSAQTEFKAQGIQFNKLSADEMKKWYAVYDTISADWVKQMAAKNLPGQAVLDSFKKAAGR